MPNSCYMRQIEYFLPILTRKTYNYHYQFHQYTISDNFDHYTRQGTEMRIYKLILTFLSIFLFNTVAYADRMSIPANERELLPSMPPGPDCNWDNFQSQELGIRMLVQNCPKSSKSYQFFTRDNAIIAKEIIKSSGLSQENIIIKIFHKLPDITIRDAIRQQFINQLADEALANCQVKRISDRLVLLSEQVTLEISPTGDYALKIDEEIKNGRKDYGCGDYGAVISGERYFVFHPDEDMKKFAFIQMPQNKSLFDRDSIILFSPFETHAPSGSTTPSVKSSQ